MPSDVVFRTAMVKTLADYLEKCPTTWDINNGLCESFAQDVLDRCGGETKDCHGLWLDEIPGVMKEFKDDPPGHYVIYFRGKYYDAECPNGVVDWHDIPLVKNTDKTREQVLAERV